MLRHLLLAEARLDRRRDERPRGRTGRRDLVSFPLREALVTVWVV